MDDQKLLGIAGSKQAGKDTICNFLHGLQLKWNGIVDNFYIDNDGELLVEGLPTLINGEEVKANVKLPVSGSGDYRFAAWAADSMWPFIKRYSFAEALKEMAIELFECPREFVYGTDAQKNTVMEHLLWENMPGVTTEKTPQDPVDSVVAGRLGKYYEKLLSGVIYHEAGPMTIRQFLQFLGTDIMRKMYEPAWVNRCIKDILTENSGVAVISDCRFNNEIGIVQKHGGKVIGLMRSPYEDDHPAENSIDFELCDVVIDNREMAIAELCDKVVEILKEWGWIQSFGPKPTERKAATMKINPTKAGKNI
jgi:hypothetical protein